MNLSARAFLDQPKIAVTVIGMSGLGKTYISSMLARHGWTHYSCDEVIGTKYLQSELDAPVTKENLSALSRFVGQVGNPVGGGLTLDEFRRRQKLYYDAECDALRGVGAAIEASEGHFINDSTGSLCEIMDEKIIDDIGRKTLFVYIKATPEDEATILQRAVDVPKPLFFPPDHFDGWLKDFMDSHQIAHVGDIVPDEFSRWVFPRLFHSRLPKYRKLADRYGVTIMSDRMAHVQTEKEFLDRVAEALYER